jgi:FMN reductase
MAVDDDGSAEVVVVCGNPRPASRTLAAATRIGAGLASATGLGGPAVIDLATVAGELFGPRLGGLGGLDAALARVRDARALVVATPVYKGSFTGLVKAFLDLLPPDALRGAVAVPVSVSAAPAHRYVAELALRPVLVELGASVPTASLGLQESQLPDLDAVLDDWLARHGRQLRLLAGVVQEGQDQIPSELIGIDEISGTH